MQIGFSTGAVAFGDFRKALAILSRFDVNAVELSALRLSELSPLVHALEDLDLSQFDHIAFHAPSKFSTDEEPLVIDELAAIAERDWPIVLHPDSIHNLELWMPYQSQLCFENMDKRKPIGRTASELERIFSAFRGASLCFDIGHAHQIDRTMTEARVIGQRFQSRMRQVHVSEVNTNSQHVALSAASVMAFHEVADLVGEDVPLIIESVVSEAALADELACTIDIFRKAAVGHLLETD